MATPDGAPPAATGARAGVVVGAWSLLCLLSLWRVVMQFMAVRWAYRDPAQVELEMWLTMAYLLALGVVNGRGAWRGLRADAPVRMPRLLTLALVSLLLGFALNLMVSSAASGVVPREVLVGPWPSAGFAALALVIQAGVAMLLARLVGAGKPPRY